VPSRKIVLRWLGAAGFHLRYRGGELLLDPFLSRFPGAEPVIRARASDFGAVSLILVSHGHFDHAMDAAELARISGARVQAPLRTLSLLKRRGVDPARLVPNERLPACEWNGVTIRTLPSKHIAFDPPLIRKTLVQVLRGRVFTRLAGLVRAWPIGSNSEFLLCFPGYRILFSGSGGGDWRTLAELHPHCCLLPFAGRTDPAELYLRALRLLRPQTVVLHHYDKFFPSFCVDYPVESFRERLARELPGIRLIVPQPESDIVLP
jgi:L-ascorbate metabolism protein UlaG (beta-lactamase superfamily)